MRGKRFLPWVLSVWFCVFAVSNAFAAGLEEELQANLREAASVARAATAKSAGGARVAEETARLRSIAENVQIIHLMLEERFKERSAGVAALGGPAVERHRAMEARYHQVITDFLALIDALPDEDALTPAALQPLLNLLDTLLPPQKRPILGSLPYSHLHYPARKPVAAPLIVPAYRGGDHPAVPADLQGTADAPITPEIAELAKSLDWNPVRIYEWMQENIETEWYWGSMKGAEETLRQKSGNDADQAALLIALLRSAGFPARYVRGVIEFFPGIEQAKRLTGLDDPLKIAAFLQKAGIPFEPVIAGGRIGNFRIEHIWVETFVPYANYRGAILDNMGKIWTPLDTHMKPPGYRWNAPEDFAADFNLSAWRDEYLSHPRTETPLEYLRDAFDRHLAGNFAASTYHDHLRTRTLIVEPLGLLPGSLQFHQVAVTGEYAELPADLRHQVTFTAAAPDGGELFAIVFDAASLSSRAVTLHYEPETVQDQKIINSYGGLDNTPSYLVRLRPVLKVDGERMVVGRDGLPMGGDYTLTIGLTAPNGQQEFTSHHIIGNLAALGIVSQQVIQPAELPLEEKDAERLLHEAALSYIDNWNQAEEELSAFLKVTVARPLPTVVTVGGVIDVSHLFDIPQGFEWKGVFIDAALRRIETVTAPGQEGRAKEFMRLSSLQGSILEHRLFEDHFQVASVSTAKLLALAPQQAAPLVTLNAQTAEALLPQLALPAHIEQDIRNAVLQGYVVTLPERELAYQSWRGIGYLKEHPESGEAGYMLSGMIAGGMTAKEWAEGYLRDILQTPYGDPPNQDAQAAAHIARIPVGDRQNGIVGRPVDTPLAVLVTDLKGRPVVGAQVTFTRLAGGGGLDGETFAARTGANGIATLSPALGLQTADNPTFQMVNRGDTFATQVGLNLFGATVASRYGELAIPQPFQVYARPDAPSDIVKVLGEGSMSLANNPAGTLKVRVVDRHGNPVSNIPVTFTAKEAHSQEPLMPLPPGYRNIEFYLKDDCSVPYPLYGDCASTSSFTRTTGHHGAGVETLLGNTVNTRYTVEAAAPGLAATTFELSTYGYMKQGDYLAPELFIGQFATVNDRGELVNAAKAGTDLQAPLTAALFMLSNGYSTEKYTCGTDEEDKPVYCWRLKGDGRIETARITSNGTVIFTPKAGNGQAAPTQTGGDGLYRSTYTTGAQPARNIIEAVGEATLKDIPEVYYDARGNAVKDGYGSATLPLRTVTVKSGQRLLFNRTSKELMPNPNPQKTTYAVYGVDVPTAVTPGLVLLGDGGMARQNVTIDYVIEPAGAAPAGYQALSAQVDLFEDSGAWAGYLVGSAISGSGQAVFSRGSVFDPKKHYVAQTILNRGSAIEIRGDKVPIATLLADLDIDSDNNAGTHDDGTHKDPSRNPLEEQVEDLAGYPGKVIKPNLLDVTGNKVPGFADGINMHGNEGDGRSALFVPVIIELAGSALDPARATVRFDYPGSDPAKVQKSADANGEARYTPAPGNLRLWTKDGGHSRNVADLAEGGDYLTPNKTYTFAQLAPVATDGGWKLYLEGLTASNGTGDQRIVIHIDPDGDGPLPAIEGDAVRATAPLVGLVPDYNHNREIDEEDRQRAARGDTFYFWINDDDDYGETGGSDIPGAPRPLGTRDNWDDKVVNGVRDLIDFYPVHLDIQGLLNLFDPAVYRYVLSSKDANVNLMTSSLGAANAGDYLVEVETAKAQALEPVMQVTASGIDFSGLSSSSSSYGRPVNDQAIKEKLKEFLLSIRGEETKGVLLFEGAKKGKSPLTLTVYDEANNPAFAAALNLSIDGVEQMFRHKNLIQSIGEAKAPPLENAAIGESKTKGGEIDRTGEPQNFPDSESKNEYVVWVHGFNVNGQQVRGWHSEMFKRLYWSGSRARFVGLSWFGFEEQPVDYHANVVHAFKTAEIFGGKLKEIVGDAKTTILAHSLGNMLASSYLCDHLSKPSQQLNIRNYFLLNAAVALEAYLGDYQGYADTANLTRPFDGSEESNGMVHTSWHGYHRRFGASEWHQLFVGDIIDGQPDQRARLTWRGRFADLPTDEINVFSFYSTGEDVLASFAGTLPTFQQFINLDFGRNSWVLQEKWKGKFPVNYLGSKYMGWGFNYEDYTNWIDSNWHADVGIEEAKFLSPAEANSLLNSEELRTKPFFRSFSEGQGEAQLLVPGRVGSEYARANRPRLLGLAIPALTTPVGGWKGADIGAMKNTQKYNMSDQKNDWPCERLEMKDWLHSDIRDVAFPYVYKPVFEIVGKGDLQ